MTAAAIQFDENFAQNLLSKNYVLLRLLFKCGCNKSAATNTVITVHAYVTKERYFHRIWGANILDLHNMTFYKNLIFNSLICIGI